MTKPSLRHIASELDISPAYLSYMVNGKRPWRKDLYQRYMGVVNTFVNSTPRGVNEIILNSSKIKYQPTPTGALRPGSSGDRAAAF